MVFATARELPFKVVRLREELAPQWWVMYYTVVVCRWCIALAHESWMRLTFRRDAIPERDLFRDVLVCAELISASDVM